MITSYALEKSFVILTKNFMECDRAPNITLLQVNIELISEFEDKANIFDKYFVSQCTTINNNSVLLPSTLNRLTDSLTQIKLMDMIKFL